MSEENTIESYNRPNLNWICTNTEGCGCPGGPTSDGRCPGKLQCTPVRHESSWKCSRSQVHGGACETGPDPSGNCCTPNIGCVPKRNLRSKRKIFVVCSVAVVTGILLLGIWTPNRTEFLAPGGLSANHAQIWSSGNNSDRCVACHAAGAANPISWLVDAVSGGSHIGQPQYQKCLVCHEDTLGAEHALLVHNVSKQTISNVSASHADMASEFKLFSSPVNHNGEIACAQCHQEHHGADHHLSAMTDSQCQSCHQSQFKSFESGHPEFTTLLEGSRTKIAFDHFSHQSKHFATTNQSFDCKSCHIGDQFESVMQTKPFEESCGSCHNEKIEASLSQGLPVFSLPILDSSLLKRNGLDVGQWPQLADGGFDGSIPPLMKVLLSSDPRAANAMKFLGPEFDLFEIDETDSAQLKAAYQLAIATKSLMFDLSANGQMGLAKRLETIAGDSVPQSKLRMMLGSLSADTFVQAQKQWFPDLGEEIDLIQINSNDIPLEIASSETQPVKTFDVLLTTFVQQENELAPNPLKRLFVPDNQTITTEPSVQNATPASNTNTNTNPESVKLRDEPKSQLIEFEDLPLVDSITENPITENSTAVSGQANQPLQQMKRIENKFYRAPLTNDSKQTNADAENSKAPDPKVIVIRSGDLPTPKQESADKSQATDLLATNPLKNKMDLLENKGVKTEPARSTQSENPTQHSPIKAEAANPRTFSDNSNSRENLEANQTKTSSRENVPENELLADNPLSKMFVPDEPKTSQATTPEVNQNANSLNDENAENAISKSIEPQPELGFGPLQMVNPNPPGPTPDSTQIADSNAKPNGNEDVEPKTPGPVRKPRRKIKRLPANQMVAMGGWYRDDATFTIAYRQAGHADSVTVNWYDFVSSIPNAKENPMYSDFTLMMTKSTSPGLCSTCHSVDRQPDHSLSFNWNASYRDISTRDFTRFSHRPHLVQGKADQCSTCHQILPGSNVMQNYLSSESEETLFDSKGCANGFAPMTKSNCVQCHNNRSKIQNCTQCHNYHVGSKVTRIKK